MVKISAYDTWGVFYILSDCSDARIVQSEQPNMGRCSGIRILVFIFSALSAGIRQGYSVQKSYFYKISRFYIAANKGNRDEIQSMSTIKSGGH